MVSLDYIAGLFDGDGSLYVVVSGVCGRKINPSHNVFACIASTHTQTLEAVRDVLGGNLRPQPVSNPHHKPQYQLMLPVAAIPQIAPRVFLKRTQAEAAVKLLSMRHSGSTVISPDELVERDRLAATIKAENQKHRCNHDDAWVPSDEYIAGFIDAEGSIGIYKREHGCSRRVEISAHNNYACILERIESAMGGSVRRGKGDAWRWEIRSRAIDDAIDRISPFLITKAERCQVARDFRKLQGRKLSNSALLEAAIIAQETMRNLNRKGVE